MAVKRPMGGCWREHETEKDPGRNIWLRPSRGDSGGFTDGEKLWDGSNEVECARCGQIGPGFIRRMDGEERCRPEPKKPKRGRRNAT